EDLLSLLAFNDLAFHHLAVDLHREAEQDGGLGEREAERSFGACGDLALEDVVDLGVHEIALDVSSNLERLEANGLRLAVLAWDLERSDGGHCGHLDDSGELRVGGGPVGNGERGGTRDDQGQHKKKSLHWTLILPTVTV